MPKVNFMDRENVLREFEMKEDLITLGREATNKVVVADPSVSRHHAQIERKEDGYYLSDKNSSNGTYINGKKISSQRLRHNDKINLGSASLVFEDEEEGATFIVPRSELPQGTRPDLGPNDRETDAFTSPDIGQDREEPLPPPPPLVSVSPAPAPPPPPKPASPPSAPKAEPAGEVGVGILCPTCRKVVEHGARFCPFCGTALAAPKAAAPPPPAAAPPPASPKFPAPPPLAAKPSVPPPSPAVPRPVAPPAFGVSAPGSPVAAAAAHLQYAGFGSRLVAYLIDTVILLLLIALPLAAIFVVGAPLRGTERPSPIAMLILLGCTFAIFMISVGYQLYFIGAKGATPGKRMMKLRVTLPDGQYPVGYGKAFLRMIGYAISGMVCYLGFLWILIDKEQHRGWHDKIAGTVVIKES